MVMERSHYWPTFSPDGDRVINRWASRRYRTESFFFLPSFDQQKRIIEKSSQFIDLSTNNWLGRTTGLFRRYGGGWPILSGGFIFILISVDPIS